MSRAVPPDGSGPDTVESGAGDDWMRGGGDNDELVSGSGDDCYDGGPGNDVLDDTYASDLDHYMVDQVWNDFITEPFPIMVADCM